MNKRLRSKTIENEKWVLSRQIIPFAKGSNSSSTFKWCLDYKDKLKRNSKLGIFAEIYIATKVSRDLKGIKQFRFDQLDDKIKKFYYSNSNRFVYSVSLHTRNIKRPFEEIKAPPAQHEFLDSDLWSKYVTLRSSKFEQDIENIFSSLSAIVQNQDGRGSNLGEFLLLEIGVACEAYHAINKFLSEHKIIPCGKNPDFDNYCEEFKTAAAAMNDGLEQCSNNQSSWLELFVFNLFDSMVDHFKKQGYVNRCMRCGLIIPSIPGKKRCSDRVDGRNCNNLDAWGRRNKKKAVEARRCISARFTP